MVPYPVVHPGNPSKQDSQCVMGIRKVGAESVFAFLFDWPRLAALPQATRTWEPYMRQTDHNSASLSPAREKPVAQTSTTRGVWGDSHTKTQVTLHSCPVMCKYTPYTVIYMECEQVPKHTEERNYWEYCTEIPR